MANLPSYDIVQFHLRRYQQAENYAAQARTLMVMARLIRNDDAYGHSLVHGLYGQAWAAYTQANDILGQVTAIFGTMNALRHASEWWWRRTIDEETRQGYLHAIRGLTEMIFTLCQQEEDLRKRALLYRALDHHSRFRDLNQIQRAYQEAQACYEALGDPREQANMIVQRLRLTPYHNDVDGLVEARQLYHAAHDSHNEGKIWVMLGQRLMWQKQPDLIQVRAYFETARDLFLESRSRPDLFHTLVLLLEVVGRAEAYDVYLDEHDKTIRLLQNTLSWSKVLNPFERNTILKIWRHTIQRACQQRDFAMARRFYEQALSMVVTIGIPEEQCGFYYQWALMEYHRLGHHMTGLALYEKGLVLHRQYGLPKIAHRQYVFNLMRANA